MKVKIKVIPNSKKNEIRGFREGVLYIKISAPPVKGRANRELVKFLEKKLNVKGIKIVSGEKTRIKIVDIPLLHDEIVKRLNLKE